MLSECSAFLVTPLSCDNAEWAILYKCTCKIRTHISEGWSVESLCRDGADTPISFNKSNSLELSARAICPACRYAREVEVCTTIV